MMGWMAPLRHLSAKLLSDRISSEWEPSMGEVTTIGLDLAKHVFQVHGIDAQGTTVLRKRLRRGQVLAFFSRIPRCVVGLEACATGQTSRRCTFAMSPPCHRTANSDLAIPARSVACHLINVFGPKTHSSRHTSLFRRVPPNWVAKW
jgi:hypothetical protein